MPRVLPLAALVLGLSAAPALAVSTVSLVGQGGQELSGPAADVTARILVEPADGVTSIDLFFHYDPAVLTPTAVFKTAFTNSFTLNYYLGTPGTVEIHLSGATPLVGTDPGAPDVAWVTFRVIGSGGTTGSLAWDSAVLNAGAIASTTQVTPDIVVSSSSATVSVPDNLQIPAGGTVVVNVSATTYVNQSSMTLRVRYNQYVAEVTGVSNSGLVTSPLALTWSLHPGGDLWIVMSGTANVTGSGTVVRITFTATGGQGSTMPLNLYRSQVGSQIRIADDGTLSVCPASCDDGNLCTTDSCVLGQCSHVPVPTTTVCRAAAPGGCDVAETCDADGNCPANAFAPPTTVCRAPTDLCDAAETCTGSSAACPADAVLPAATVCRGPAGDCDVAEVCNGTTKTCPSNVLAPSTTVCRPSAGACDVPESCTGSSAACPTDTFLPSSSSCRSSAGACDVAESCTGSSAACPADVFRPSSTACGDPGTSACDNPDHCSGTDNTCVPNHVTDGTSCGTPGVCEVQDTCLDGACHDNGFLPASTACGDPSVSDCDGADHCSGTDNTCVPNHVTDGTACGTPGACEVQDTCLDGACHDNGFKPATAACGDPGSSACDNPDHCSGTDNSCVPNHVTDGAACGTPGPCEVQDTCLGGVCQDNEFKPATAACGDPGSSACDNPDHCSGTDNSCVPNHATDGALCGTRGECEVQDTCLDGVCHDNGFKPATTACGDPSTSVCDNPDHCSGTDSTCVANHVTDGTSCGTPGVCEVQDTCLDGACHDNGFKPATAACGDPSVSVCDGADHCSGTDNTCVPNHVTDGTACGTPGVCEIQDTCLDGACHDNEFKPATAACGDPSLGACDGADHCSGTDDTCVPNHATNGTSCGPPGACEIQDTCVDGACQDNGFKPATAACGDPGASACDNPDHCSGTDNTCVPNHVTDGTACGTPGVCEVQDTCLDGVCHDSGFKPATAACGDPSSSVCDNPDHCSGTDNNCVPNHVADGTACGTPGVCEVQDTCLDGACHDNGFKPATAACGDPSVSDCDGADHCSGTDNTCVPNLATDGTSCGTPGVCEVQDTCLGGVCHDNGFKPATSACGDPSTSACDNPDHCSGTDNTCVPNHVTNGTSCGTPGVCEFQDTCLDGVCQDSGFKPATSACGAPSASACDNPDHCSGTDDTCVPNHVTNGTSCGTPGVCELQDTCLDGACQDNGFKPATAACGDPSVSDCDGADHCSGTDNTCVPNHATDGTSCGTPGVCEVQDTCLDGACHDNGFKPGTAACGDPSVSDCDGADHCSGTDNTCMPNHATDGTSCGAPGECEVQDTCLEGVCQDNGFKPATAACGDPSSSACDSPDHCSGTDGTCVPNHVTNGTSCGTPGVCEVQDTCLDGACHDNGFKPATAACGDPSVSACDGADHCSGTDNTCVPNHVTNGTSCGTPGVCEVQDTCLDGVCHDNRFKPATAACGDPSVSDCDGADHCSGTDNTCVPNLATDGTSCGTPGVCEVQDTCLGGVCRDNGFKPATSACGDPSTSACDNPDHCSGTDSTCMPNHVTNGTSCGTPGVCEFQDTCLDGVCQDSGFKPATSACGDPSASACDNPDHCSGTDDTCVPNHVTNGTSCGTPGVCELQDTCLDGACQDNGFKPATAACGDPSTSACDNPDHCSGTDNTCVPNHVTNGTSCGTPGVCEVQDTCLDGVCQDNGFKPATAACGDPSSSVCDNPDHCSGTDNACVSNHVADGTSCGPPPGECEVQDTCLDGACHENGFKPVTAACGDPSSSACDNPDHCSGVANQCLPARVADGTSCGTPAPCEVQDTCLAGVCHDNGFKPATAVCRPSTGECDVAESCTGTGPECPPDGVTQPPAGSPLLFLKAEAAGTLVSWSALLTATSYDVARGSLAVLRATGGDFTPSVDSCLADGTQTTSLHDQDQPASGDAFWYLVRPVNCGGPGTYDTGSPAQIGARDAEIQASPHACP